jgi:hypothetical protein
LRTGLARAAGPAFAVQAAPGAIVALLGMAALYVLTVTVVARGLRVILGQAALFALLTVFVMLNFPSPGGVMAGVMLPTFWHELNRFWIGAPAVRRPRSSSVSGRACRVHPAEREPLRQRRYPPLGSAPQPGIT